uniref:Putative secreted protein n=1 Tax=Ixodes ricinus TaxID=34613 RepID=A0A6B0TTY2_IXORI
MVAKLPRAAVTAWLSWARLAFRRLSSSFSGREVCCWSEEGPLLRASSAPARPSSTSVRCHLSWLQWEESGARFFV